MENSELTVELLQGLTNDVKQLTKLVKGVPTGTPPDYGPQLERLARSVEQLQTKIAQPAIPAPAQVDTSAFSSQLNRIEQKAGANPALVIEKGTTMLVVMYFLIIAACGFVFYKYFAQQDEIAKYELINWKWRMVQQEAAVYADKIDKKFSTSDKIKHAQTWIIEHEQADATRTAAQKDAERASALNAQADALEGKRKESSGKRKKASP